MKYDIDNQIHEVPEEMINTVIEKVKEVILYHDCKFNEGLSYESEDQEG